MAFLISPYKLKGKIDDLAYCSTEDGVVVKGKGGASAEQVKNSPGMENTRRLNRDFAEAVRAAKLVRLALDTMEDSVMSGKMIGRLNSLFGRVVKEDMLHEWGARRTLAGDLSLLAGFEFNHKLSLDDALPLNIDDCYQIAAGKVALQVSGIRVRRKKKLPATATHYKLVSCMLTIDFDSRQFTRTKLESELYAMGRKAGGAFTAEHLPAPDDRKGCLWLAGIEFYKMENRKPVLVKGGALRMMEWIDVYHACLYDRKVPAANVGQDRLSADFEDVEDDCLVGVEEERFAVMEAPTLAAEEAVVMEDVSAPVPIETLDISPVWERATEDHERVEVYVEAVWEAAWAEQDAVNAQKVDLQEDMLCPIEVEEPLDVIVVELPEDRLYSIEVGEPLDVIERDLPEDTLHFTDVGELVDYNEAATDFDKSLFMPMPIADFPPPLMTKRSANRFMKVSESDASAISKGPEDI